MRHLVSIPVPGNRGKLLPLKLQEPVRDMGRTKRERKEKGNKRGGGEENRIKEEKLAREGHGKGHHMS